MDFVQSLLNLLFENWILVLLGIWFLRILTKRGEQKQSNNTREYREVQSEKQTVNNPMQTVRRVEATLDQRVSSDLSAATLEKAEDAFNPYMREESRPYERENQAPYQRDQQQPYQRGNTKPYRQARKKEKWDVDTNRSALQRGIIWSEILGPPRAKRPYRPPHMK